MTYQEITTQIKYLSIGEQNALLQSLIELLHRTPDQHSIPSGSLARVRGMLKSDTPPPTDAKLMEDYTHYLIEKYV